MTFVITRSCEGTCDTACVDVCPCDCIAGPVPVALLREHKTPDRGRRFAGVQLFIDPAECIDCGACVPECPVDAIEADVALADDDHDLRRNAAFFERT